MYLWSFLTYGFLGYLLEKVYALVTRSRHTVRKGYLLLPVCPVYGLAMLAVLALPPDMTDTFWHLALYGGLTATAVEYAVHFCCDRLLGVMFWDYSSDYDPKNALDIEKFLNRKEKIHPDDTFVMVDADSLPSA